MVKCSLGVQVECTEMERIQCKKDSQSELVVRLVLVVVLVVSLACNDKQIRSPFVLHARVCTVFSFLVSDLGELSTSGLRVWIGLGSMRDCRLVSVWFV
jgi:hypothetical protein